MKTYTLKAAEVERTWHVLDATDVPLGRLAARAASLMRGKHKPTFSPHLDMGDFVVVVNAEKVRLSSDPDAKKYIRHSGYPGGLKERTFRQMIATHPERVIEQAVKGMLPHNRLGRKVMHHLKVYAGPTHPHEAQVRAGDGARAARRAKAATAAEPPPAAAAAAPAQSRRKAAASRTRKATPALEPEEAIEEAIDSAIAASEPEELLAPDAPARGDAPAQRPEDIVEEVMDSAVAGAEPEDLLAEAPAPEPEASDDVKPSRPARPRRTRAKKSDDAEGSDA